MNTNDISLFTQAVWNGTGNATAAGSFYSYDVLATYDATQFHTWGVDWTSSTVTFYMDRVATCSFPTPAGYTSPMYAILSSEIGSSGTIAAGATLAPMQVDCVKVWTARPF